MTRKDINLLAEAFSSTKPKTINEQSGDAVYGLINTADGPTLVGLYASQEQAQQALDAFLATPEGENETDYFYITPLALGQPVNFDYIYDTQRH